MSLGICIASARHINLHYTFIAKDRTGPRPLWHDPELPYPAECHILWFSRDLLISLTGLDIPWRMIVSRIMLEHGIKAQAWKVSWTDRLFPDTTGFRYPTFFITLLAYLSKMMQECSYGRDLPHQGIEDLKSIMGVWYLCFLDHIGFISTTCQKHNIGQIWTAISFSDTFEVL